MLEFSVPKITTLSSIPKSRRRRRVVFVTMPKGDPFDLIGPMAVLNDTNWQLENSGRPDLGYDMEVVTNKPGTVYQVNGFRMVVDKQCYEIRGDVDTIVFQDLPPVNNPILDEFIRSGIILSDSFFNGIAAAPGDSAGRGSSPASIGPVQRYAPQGRGALQVHRRRQSQQDGRKSVLPSIRSEQRSGRPARW